ncbi:hypothetical protein L915_21082 [Phytophthora nicotianae]|uniref:Uncharacterized protein n=1 Tax=Phytophthora nicotianae TaxID=4792 RepID=W2FP70_PHYNI|nr:hypothetical protein L915_21082 [Phytophthora nicotianae]
MTAAATTAAIYTTLARRTSSKPSTRDTRTTRVSRASTRIWYSEISSTTRS